MQWRGKTHATADVKRFRTTRRQGKFRHVFAHSGYLINIAAPRSANREKSIESLVLELRLAEDLGLPFLVLHPGAHLGHGEEAGIRNGCAALEEALEATRGARVRIALENTAGQGTCLGHRLEQLGRFFQGIKEPARLGVCLDTAHLFAAGYNIRTQRGWEKVIAEVTQHIGRRRVLAFHLNDSKTELGSRVDRHAHIGEGKIGLKAFGRIINDPRFRKHPACIETPKSEDLHEDRQNLAVLRSLLR